MRLTKNLLFLAPLLSKARGFIHQDEPIEQPAVPALQEGLPEVLLTVSLLPASIASVDLRKSSEDEPYDLQLEYITLENEPHPSEETPCDVGLRLKVSTSSQGPSIRVGTLDDSIESEVSHVTTLTAACDGISDHTGGEVADPRAFVKVPLEAQEWKSTPSLDVVLDTRSKSILEVRFNSTGPAGTGPWVKDHVCPECDSSDSVTPSTDVSTDNRSLEDEIAVLRSLEAYLEGLNDIVAKQRGYVDDLQFQQSNSGAQELKQCSNPKCYIKTLLSHLRRCIHLVALRFAPHKRPSPDDLQTFSRFWPSHQSSVSEQPNPPQILKTSPTHQPHQPSAAHRPLPPHAPLSLSNHHYGQIDLPRLKVYLLLGAAVSFLAFTCIFACLHRQCCSPRKKADRRARREEQRRACQYRQLARRHAWREWWNTRAWRNGRRTGDYEEKRALIREQEGILENAMQTEIQRLEQEHGQSSRPPFQHMDTAEQGRINHFPSRPSSRTDSLPTYRSRTSSGRPPSYHSREDPSERSHSGEATFTPAMTDITPDDSASYMSDATPESSIANLSPRISSETLRTEASV